MYIKEDPINPMMGLLRFVDERLRDHGSTKCFKRAVNEWIKRDPERTFREYLRHDEYEGWTFRDVIRVAHPDSFDLNPVKLSSEDGEYSSINKTWVAFFDFVMKDKKLRTKEKFKHWLRNVHSGILSDIIGYRLPHVIIDVYEFNLGIQNDMRWIFFDTSNILDPKWIWSTEIKESRLFWEKNFSYIPFKCLIENYHHLLNSRVLVPGVYIDNFVKSMIIIINKQNELMKHEYNWVEPLRKYCCDVILEHKKRNRLDYRWYNVHINQALCDTLEMPDLFK